MRNYCQLTIEILFPFIQYSKNIEYLLPYIQAHICLDMTQNVVNEINLLKKMGINNFTFKL